jgi:hypothetical protein
VIGLPKSATGGSADIPWQSLLYLPEKNYHRGGFITRTAWVGHFQMIQAARSLALVYLSENDLSRLRSGYKPAPTPASSL